MTIREDIFNNRVKLPHIILPVPPGNLGGGELATRTLAQDVLNTYTLDMDNITISYLTGLPVLCIEEAIQEEFDREVAVYNKIFNHVEHPPILNRYFPCEDVPSVANTDALFHLCNKLHRPLYPIVLSGILMICRVGAATIPDKLKFYELDNKHITIFFEDLETIVKHLSKWNSLLERDIHPALETICYNILSDNLKYDDINSIYDD